MSSLKDRENRRRSIVGSMIGYQEPGTKNSTEAGENRDRSEEKHELKKRVTLSLIPSVYEDVQKIAYVQQRSVSELVGDLLEAYRSEHQYELDLYKEFKRKLQ